MASDRKLYPQTVTARLTDRQASHITKSAKKAELSPAAYLRELVKKDMREVS